ncbi:MAG TPA: hypothetical protein DEH15_04370 [Marinilabiliales bacterium]|nr:hypothetical protein [Marinilabiliales bacterium]
MSDSLNLIRDFDFVNQFLYEYQVKKIPTPSTYKLEEVVGKIELEDGMVNLINISGGIKFGKEVKLLNYGDYGQLKNIVLTSRPSDTTLFWQLPINGWVIPNFKDIISTTHNNPDNGDKNGSYVKSQTVVVNPNVHLPINNVNSFNGFMPVHSSPPKLKGVQMKMIIDNSSFKKDSKLNSLRDSILRDVNQKH